MSTKIRRKLTELSHRLSLTCRGQNWKKETLIKILWYPAGASLEQASPGTGAQWGGIVMTPDTWTQGWGPELINLYSVPNQARVVSSPPLSVILTESRWGKDVSHQRNLFPRFTKSENEMEFRLLATDSGETNINRANFLKAICNLRPANFSIKD